MKPSEALAIALAQFDHSPTALAAAIGGSVKRQNVEYWIASGYVPAAQCPGVERAVGARVTCEQLCSAGVHWARVPDKDWPGKRGRPTLDVARAEATKAAA